MLMSPVRIWIPTVRVKESAPRTKGGRAEDLPTEKTVGRARTLVYSVMRPMDVALGRKR